MATYTFDKIEYGGNTYVVSDSGALQLTGGQVTGPVTFGDSISIDEATLGDLVVNGSASFTNNIQANTINGGHPTYFIKGTQTAATNVWTGTLPDGVTYYNGLTIDYLLPYAGNSSAATLNLSGLGAKPVYYGNSATGGTTTHYGANTVIHLTYVIDSAFNSGNGCWKASNYYDSNTVDRLRNSYFRPYAGEAIYRYKFVMQGVDNRVYPIVVTDQTNATQVAKVPTQVGLRPGRIWYYNTTGTVAAGAVVGANSLDSAYQTTIAVYNFNTDIAAYRMLYLRGTYNKTTDLFTLYKDSSSPCTSYYTQVPTNTANITLSSYFTSGYYYMLLGGTYSSANYISLFDYNPLYYFDGTNLIPVSTKVAQDTNTDTKNTAGSTNTSSKIFLIGATSQAANPQTYSHDTAYVGTDGCLYSGGTKVLTAHQDISGKIDTAGTGLSKSGTTLNHTNSVTAQTTQAVYPIKIDAQGHISAYGSAVTIPSAYSLPTASSDTLGGVKVGYTTSGNNRAVQIDSNGNLYVVQKDDNTTYTNLKLGQGYGTCSTASTTYAKAVTCSNFQLSTGGIIAVLFSNAASYITTLNVNSTGAKYVKYKTTTATSSSPINPSIAANYVAYFMYDGTNYVLLNWQHTTASSSRNGYMSAEQATKLDGIGSTDTSSKIYLIGATSQTADPSTYSHDTAYVGTDGCLYSGGVKVLTAHQTAVTSLTTTAGTHTTKTSATGAVSMTIPTKTSHLTNDSGFISTAAQIIRW